MTDGQGDSYIPANHQVIKSGAETLLTCQRYLEPYCISISTSHRLTTGLLECFLLSYNKINYPLKHETTSIKHTLFNALSEQERILYDRNTKGCFLGRKKILR